MRSRGYTNLPTLACCLIRVQYQIPYYFPDLFRVQEDHRHWMKVLNKAGFEYCLDAGERGSEHFIQVGFHGVQFQPLSHYGEAAAHAVYFFNAFRH